MEGPSNHVEVQPKTNGVSLGSILDFMEEPHNVPTSWTQETGNGDARESDAPRAGFCVECGQLTSVWRNQSSDYDIADDQPAEVFCTQCEDAFCKVCCDAQHRKGNRRLHERNPLGKKSSAKQLTHESVDGQRPNGVEQQTVDEEEGTTNDDDVLMLPGSLPSSTSKSSIWFLERARYIPLRLTLQERKVLRLLEAALNVSEYTDKIDTLGFSLSKPKRIVHQIRELCAILSGLLLAADYKRGQDLFTDRDFSANESFFQVVFELGRRHKIMNPDKMRTTYGKLIYLLQDSQIPEVAQMLEFSCVCPIVTVHDILAEHNALGLLENNLIATATKEIYAEGRSRREVQKEIKSKERAIEALASQYAKGDLSEETVRQCIYSIGDNHAFLRINTGPCDRMIEYLKKYFHPTQAQDSKRSLAIRSGKGGARLSHDHARQYSYVLQSLTLWREILHDFFELWSLAEMDLLSPSGTYRLRDTGQGLNRVQPAPKTSRKMYTILHKAQQSIGNWVGSSVVHMGDTAVPNALMFIDKYTQIYRILLPICTTLSQIPRLVEKPTIRSYIEDEFGSEENLYLEILADFFRHGFDGSGADNFYDAGSCIDGRLTSAWNWGSTIEKKRYHAVFLLTGFVSFDGEW